MKRKVVQQGAATLMISLPAKWTKQFGVKKGGELDIEEKGNKLTVSTEKAEREKATIELKGESGEKSANLDILSLYLEGLDEIEVKVDNPKVIRNIQKEILSVLVGFEVVRQSKDYCVIKEIAVPAEYEFDNMLKRIWFLVEQMGEEILDVVEKGGKELEHIGDIDINLNKFAYFCMRALNKKSGSRRLYLIINYLEIIGDAYKKIASLVTESKLKMNKEELSQLKYADNLIKDFEKLFYSYNSESKGKFISDYKKIRESLKKTKPTAINIYLHEIIYNIGEMLTHLGKKREKD